MNPTTTVQDIASTIYGHVGTDLFGKPIQGLYDWNDQNGAARASVRLDVDNWTGHRFTDFMNP